MAVLMHLLRSGAGYSRRLFKPLDFWVGATERATATTLVLVAPGYVAAFAGGWIALKLAVKWQRSPEPEALDGGLMAMVGGVWSFAIAIAAGVWANPGALQVFQAPR